jgi:hypothetical protein
VSHLCAIHHSFAFACLAALPQCHGHVSNQSLKPWHVHCQLMHVVVSAAANVVVGRVGSSLRTPTAVATTAALLRRSEGRVRTVPVTCAGDAEGEEEEEKGDNDDDDDDDDDDCNDDDDDTVRAASCLAPPPLNVNRWLDNADFVYELPSPIHVTSMKTQTNSKAATADAAVCHIVQRTNVRSHVVELAPCSPIVYNRLSIKMMRARVELHLITPTVV